MYMGGGRRISGEEKSFGPMLYRESLLQLRCGIVLVKRALLTCGAFSRWMGLVLLNPY